MVGRNVSQMSPSALFDVKSSSKPIDNRMLNAIKCVILSQCDSVQVCQYVTQLHTTLDKLPERCTDDGVAGGFCVHPIAELLRCGCGLRVCT